MANICDTEYKIFGNTKDIDKLNAVLEQLWKDNRRWLGALVRALDGDTDNMCCRGDIEDFERDSDTEITIRQSTAWCEQEEVRYFLQERFPDIRILYYEEEPGCDVFCTNDLNGEVWTHNWVLDSSDGTEYFDSLEDAAKHVNKAFVSQTSGFVGEARPSEASIVSTMELLAKMEVIDEFYFFQEVERRED